MLHDGGLFATPALTPAQSRSSESILTASTYCSEKRTTSIAGAVASAGTQISTGTWQESPACRSPGHLVADTWCELVDEERVDLLDLAPPSASMVSRIRCAATVHGLRRTGAPYAPSEATARGSTRPAHASRWMQQQYVPPPRVPRTAGGGRVGVARHTQTKTAQLRRTQLLWLWNLLMTTAHERLACRRAREAPPPSLVPGRHGRGGNCEHEQQRLRFGVI